MASGFDWRRRKGVARDVTRRQSTGGASEVGLGRNFSFENLISNNENLKEIAEFFHFSLASTTFDYRKVPQGVRQRPFRGAPFTTLRFLPSLSCLCAHV